MTTRREVPLTGDTLAWVHGEIADLKSKLALVQQAVDQSRGMAADAAEKALEVGSTPSISEDQIANIATDLLEG